MSLLFSPRLPKMLPFNGVLARQGAKEDTAVKTNEAQRVHFSKSVAFRRGTPHTHQDLPSSTNMTITR